MRDAKIINDGWNCTQCGKKHEFGAYVAAHWNELLEHTCECGAKHTVRRGVIQYVQPKKGKKK